MLNSKVLFLTLLLAAVASGHPCKEFIESLLEKRAARTLTDLNLEQKMAFEHSGELSRDSRDYTRCLRDSRMKYLTVIMEYPHPEEKNIFEKKLIGSCLVSSCSKDRKSVV